MTLGWFKAAVPLKCRFCDAEAVGFFTLSDGCVCYPDDRDQLLCMQHIVKASPIGSMELKTDYTDNGTLTNWWNSR